MEHLVFHIGYHKTATTWLQENYFCKHPQINLVCDHREPSKDPLLSYLIGSTTRSFDRDTCIRIAERLPLAQDRVNLVSAERLSGHPFSGGYDSFAIAERIRSCFPDARIFMVVRNQTTIIRSIYRQLVTQGYPGNFEQFISAQSWKGTSFKRDFLQYDLMVSKYHDLFGAERVLINTYENFASDTARFLHALNHFLGIGDYQVDSPGEKLNASQPDHAILAARITNKFRKTEMNPFPIVAPGTHFLALLDKGLSLYFKARRSTLFKQSLLQELATYYHESNVSLGQLISRELAGYP